MITTSKRDGSAWHVQALYTAAQRSSCRESHADDGSVFGVLHTIAHSDIPREVLDAEYRAAARGEIYRVWHALALAHKVKLCKRAGISIFAARSIAPPAAVIPRLCLYL